MAGWPIDGRNGAKVHCTETTISRRLAELRREASFEKGGCLDNFSDFRDEIDTLGTPP